MKNKNSNCDRAQPIINISSVNLKELQDIKRDYLSRYRNNELEIERLEETIEKWESRAERVTACYDSIKTPGGDDRMQCAIDMICELRNALYDRLVDSTELRYEIENKISSVKDDRLRLILEYRYIDGMNWEHISERLHTEYRWILRLHRRALDMIELPDGYLPP